MLQYEPKGPGCGALLLTGTFELLELRRIMIFVCVCVKQLSECTSHTHAPTHTHTHFNEFSGLPQFSSILSID